MKIEHGKKYVTRGGYVVMVEKRDLSDSKLYPWEFQINGIMRIVDTHGYFYDVKNICEWDIVAEYKESVGQDKSVVYVLGYVDEGKLPALSQQYRIVGEHPDYKDSFICVNGNGHVVTLLKDSLIPYKRTTVNELFCKDLVEGEVIFVRDNPIYQFVPRQFKEYESVTDSIRCWTGSGSEELLGWKYATKENPRLKSNKPKM